MACESQGQHRIAIHIPSAEEEADYIWRNLQDITFFEEHNYQVSLPEGPLIEELKGKARSGGLTNADYERLKSFVLESVYNEADYRKGHDKIRSELTLIDTMINQIDPSDFNWNFKEFETYTVNLTLYGPGGSFNPDEGPILIFTTTEGQFKSYDNAASTIIHEVVHIGMQDAIISKYNVPHPLKERIVDTFVHLNFGTYLPDYRIQNMGDTRTDPYLQKISDFRSLDTIVAEILN